MTGTANKLVYVWAIGLTAILLMGASVPNNFVGGTPISAAEMNANFTALVNSVTALEDKIPALYGDGSAGNRVVSTTETLGALPGDFNPQYGKFSVTSTGVLTVRSGTIIRCQGDFVCTGKIFVESSQGSGIQDGADAQVPQSTIPQAAASGNSAGAGEIGDFTSLRAGGTFGQSLSEHAARMILRPGLNGGGGGQGCIASAGGIGGVGGGSFVVLAAGEIFIDPAGEITANGGPGTAAGSGAGGGGIIVLASRTGITVVGALSANGGAGGAGNTIGGAGGGGGGGIIHRLAPTFVGSGTISVNGGTAGSTGPTVTAPIHQGGGGGGAGGGGGGSGGNVATSGAPGAAGPGSPGHKLETPGDPTSLFY